jgi:hypothetical protein
VFAVYLILAATVTVGPLVAVVALDGSVDAIRTVLIVTAVILVCGFSLLVIPIRSMARPRRRRPVWFPLIGSATLAVAVFFGLAIASHEFFYGGVNDPFEKGALQVILIALAGVWLVWVFVFGAMASTLDRKRFGGRLYKSLVAGSVLELLVAIPMHLAVRQRGYCCAGMGTGLGIGVGIIVMVVALGPAVVILFYRRFQQVYVHRPHLDAAADRGRL